MRNYFLALMQKILDAVVPPRTSERVVAQLTADDLLSIAQDLRPLPYQDPRVRALVWEIKYYASTHACALAGAVLGEAVFSIANEELGSLLLIPVPMHDRRLNSRGHNQTELLCTAAQAYLQNQYKMHLEYFPTALARTRLTSPQQGLPRHRRLHNVHKSMEATDKVLVAGRTCIVIDDVATTGATLAEAERALLAANAARVYLLALAH